MAASRAATETIDLKQRCDHCGRETRHTIYINGDMDESGRQVDVHFCHRCRQSRRA